MGHAVFLRRIPIRLRRALRFVNGKTLRTHIPRTCRTPSQVPLPAIGVRALGARSSRGLATDFVADAVASAIFLSFVVFTGILPWTLTPAGRYP
jgi:hypothetical protein